MTRAAFEAWAKLERPKMSWARGHNGGYLYAEAAASWRAWQASRAQAIKDVADAAADAAIRYANGHVVDFEEEMRRALGEAK